MQVNKPLIVLVITGELGVSSTLAGRRSKDDDSDGSQLCFSPTITYASSQPFTSAVLWVLVYYSYVVPVFFFCAFLKCYRKCHRKGVSV